MEKVDFEAAVMTAVQAGRNDGSKWTTFERLFMANDMVGAGAISNQQAEQGTRVTQLFSSRNTPQGRVVARYCVYVLNEEQATRHRNDPEAIGTSVRHSIVSERQGYIPPNMAIESVLIMRVDPAEEGGQVLTPIKLLFWGSSPHTSGANLTLGALA